MRNGTLSAAVGWAAIWASAASTDILVDQPHDFMDRAPAEVGTAISSAFTADDFFAPIGKTFLHSIRVSMIVSYPNTPAGFELQIHAGSVPSQPIFTYTDPSQVVDEGEWNGDPNLHLFSVRFDIDSQQLFKGPYWVVPYAIGNGSGEDRAWWGTAGNGQVSGSEGYFRSEFFGVPGWTPISESGILDFPTDFAMTIEATIPAPGAPATFGAAALLSGTARRRRL